MNVISAFFLRARHWQIFALFVAGVLQVLIGNRTLFFALAVLSVFCYFLWLWVIGSFLTTVIKPAVRLRLGFFRFTIVCLTFYFFMAIAILNKPQMPASLLDSFALLFIPLHFFSMFCVLYILYFVSKNLVLAETGKSASFYDYAGPFFLIWFVPVGVWVIQPRINRLYQAVPKPTTGAVVLESSQ